MPRNHNTYRALTAPAAMLLASAALVIAGCGGSSARKSPGTVAALGDSVAAGLGLPSSPKASSQDKLCGRSSEAYSATVAAKLNLVLANFACSGAVAANLSSSQKVNGANVPAQLNEAFANGTPKVITLTVGANDANWAGFLTDCFSGPCNTATDTNAAKADLTKMSHDLEEDLQSIQERSFADRGQVPTTVVTGYYNPTSSRCNTSASNLAWIAKETDNLNSTLKNVTEHFSFARFASLDFIGHDACSRTPWVQTSGPGFLHPTAEGQQVIAGAVLSVLHTNQG